MTSSIPAMQAVGSGSPETGAGTDGRPGAFAAEGTAGAVRPVDRGRRCEAARSISGKGREPARRPDAAEGNRSSATHAPGGRRCSEAIRSVGKRGRRRRDESAGRGGSATAGFRRPPEPGLGRARGEKRYRGVAGAGL